MNDYNPDGRNQSSAPSVDALIAAAAHQPPRLEDDPVARLLGLLPDAARTLDGAYVKAARQRAGLSASDLARQLHGRGWKVKPADVLRWETRSTGEVTPAMIAAIAAELHVAAEKIMKQTTEDRFDEVRASARFQDLVQRWADLFELSRTSAALALEHRSLATVNRGDAPDLEQMLSSLEALLDKLESREGKPR